MRVGIDLMGCDTPPHQLYEAILRAANHFDPSYTLIAFATQSAAEEIKRLHPPVQHVAPLAKIQFHLVKEVINMGDEPLIAVRRKKNSSLAAGIRFLKKRQIDAFVTAGNTGALIASTTLSMPLLPGIHRPALLALLPSEKGAVAIIDVGGNVSCKARHLIQFAQMGAAFQRCSKQVDIPRVGLLNIGVESKKGTKELRQVYQWFEEHPEGYNIAFCGNVEGREIFQGVVDVVVTDGFTGNVLLKSIEGASSFILDNIAKTVGSMEMMQQALIDLHKRFDYAEYPGAILCGVEGVVVKCHGNSSPTALFHGIQGAAKMVDLQLFQQIRQQLLLHPQRVH